MLSLDAAKGRFPAKGMTVKLPLRYAFDLQLPKDDRLRVQTLFSSTRLQIIGGPSWVGTDRFDVEAKPPQGHAFLKKKCRQWRSLWCYFCRGLRAVNIDQTVPEWTFMWTSKKASLGPA